MMSGFIIVNFKLFIKLQDLGMLINAEHPCVLRCGLLRRPICGRHHSQRAESDNRFCIRDSKLICDCRSLSCSQWFISPFQIPGTLSKEKSIMVSPKTAWDIKTTLTTLQQLDSEIQTRSWSVDLMFIFKIFISALFRSKYMLLIVSHTDLWIIFK